ncbi:Expansin-B5 [Trebouxia sp. C0009 RCD-2024]
MYLPWKARVHQVVFVQLISNIDALQSKGLQFNLDGNNQGITMFAPINNAFSAPLLADISGLDGAQSIEDLTGSIPDIVSDLLGYSVIPQRLLEAQLVSGGVFNTTNVIKTGNGVNGVPAFIPVNVRASGGVTQVAGVGSIATILQPDIEACGSIIHIISNVLLPFNVRALNLPTSTPVSPVIANSPASIVGPPVASSG